MTALADTRISNVIINVVEEEIYIPEEEWIIHKLQKSEKIIDIQAVTEDKDPNGLLGKEGGYVSCIYFSLNNIQQDKVPGNSVIEKGTDCGGAIEVYKSVEDALARCEYLSQIDGTLLYSGSYAILGTMVIRISYKLENAEQYEMTANIIREFTKLENVAS